MIQNNTCKKKGCVYGYSNKPDEVCVFCSAVCGKIGKKQDVSTNINIVSKEDYLKDREENRVDYFAFDESKVRYRAFNKGEIIHTIAHQYPTDGLGNDIQGEVILVNPKVVDGEYIVEETDVKGNCLAFTIKSAMQEEGSSTYINKQVILENYIDNE